MDTKPTHASDDGRFACDEHRPFPGTGTWFSEGWHPIRAREIRDFRREIGREPACETCAAIRRNGGSR